MKSVWWHTSSNFPVVIPWCPKLQSCTVALHVSWLPTPIHPKFSLLNREERGVPYVRGFIGLGLEVRHINHMVTPNCKGGWEM